jgi:hypothetical protein
MPTLTGVIIKSVKSPQLVKSFNLCNHHKK